MARVVIFHRWMMFWRKDDMMEVEDFDTPLPSGGVESIPLEGTPE